MNGFGLTQRGPLPPLILPSAADVAKYAPPPAVEDDFLTENEKGLPVVTRPVGKSETMKPASF